MDVMFIYIVSTYLLCSNNIYGFMQKLTFKLQKSTLILKKIIRNIKFRNEGGDLMKKFKISDKMLAVANVLAMVLVIQTSNAACLWMFNQPEYPEEAKKYSRIK